jgi:hypothetical protein
VRGERDRDARRDLDGSPVLLVSAATSGSCAATGAWAGAAPHPSGNGLGLAPVGDGYQGDVTPAGWARLASGGSLAWTDHTGSPGPLLVSLSGGTDPPPAVQPVFSHEPGAWRTRASIGR